MKKKSRILWLKIILLWNVLLVLEFKFDILSNFIPTTLFKWGIILITGLLFVMLLRITYFTFIPKVLKAKRNIKKAYTLYILANSSLGLILVSLIRSIIDNM